MIRRRIVLPLSLADFSFGIVFALAWLIAACSRPVSTAPAAPPPPAFQYFAAWGTHGNGPGQLDAPVAMAADTDSNVLIGDAESGSIQKFSINGEPRLFFQDGRFNVHPTDVAVNAGGGIYVVDEKRGNILIFSPEGDHFSEVQTGVPPAARSSIRIALDSFGTLYVAARQPFGIRKLNSSSKLEEIGSGGSTISTQLENPTSLAVGPNGLVYVSEAELPEIKVFSSAGGLQRTLSVPSNVVGTKFSGIATSGKFLFAVDAKYPAVHVWTLDGAYRLREDLSSWISGGVESQRKIACTPSGELLILDPLSWRVLRFRLHL